MEKIINFDRLILDAHKFHAVSFAALFVVVASMWGGERDSCKGVAFEPGDLLARGGCGGLRGGDAHGRGGVIGGDCGAVATRLF